MQEINAISDVTGRILRSRRVPDHKASTAMAELAAENLGEAFHLTSTPYQPVWPG